MRKFLIMFINGTLLALGGIGGSLVMRLYFLKGGDKIWLSSATQTVSFLFILLPLFISYLNHWKNHISGTLTKIFHITAPIFLASAVLGLLTGLDNFMFAYGVARLPVSTGALIISSQLGFTAGFAFFLVKQKFTSFSINAIFLISMGSVVLAFHSGSDRPSGESDREYVTGFFMTIGASALYGFVLPSIELVYKRSK